MAKPESKVKKVRKCQFLAASSIMFCLFSMPSFAASYNLQPYTSCLNGVCTTSLDITSLGLSTQKVNNIKAMNLTNFLTRSGVIDNFAWSWNGNILTVTGTVHDNVYWKVTAGTDSLDPWWNYSTYTNETTWYIQPEGGTAGGSGGQYWFGDNFTFNATRYVKYADIWGNLAGTLDLCYIIDKDGSSVLKNGTVLNNTRCDFGYYKILANAPFIILFHNPSGSRSSTAVTDPTAVGFGTINRGCFVFPTSCAVTNEYFQIKNITTFDGTDFSNFYNVSLYLNGNETSITIPNSTALNITGIVTNITGFNVSLYVNGTLVNSSLNNCSNVTKWPGGYYNITAWFGNLSANTTLTYYANLTYTVPVQSGSGVNYNVDLNDAPLTCFNSSYAQRNTTVLLNGNGTLLQEVYPCPYGCDNNTNSGCLPPPYQQNLIILGVIIVGCLIAWRLIR